jgi:lipopolysaccharide transport system permease protein
MDARGVELPAGIARPERPTLEIRPSREWFGRGLRDVWAYRELAYFLVWRDIKVRYKQTVLGASWAVIRPVTLMVVFSLVLGHYGKLPSDGIPYPLLTYTALVPWTLFESGLTTGSNSLVGNANLVSKVYFPRLLMPLAAVLGCLVDFFIAFLIVIGMMVYYGVSPNLGVVLLPAFVLLAVITAMGAGTFLAALNVRYRDFQYAAPFLVQVWLFATPVLYVSSIFPEAIQTVIGLNPMATVATGFRWALTGTPAPSALSALLSVLVAVAGLVFGIAYFQRVERTFADVI